MTSQFPKGNLYNLIFTYLCFAFVVYIICLLANYITKRYLISLVKRILLKTSPKVALSLANEKITTKTARIAPALLLYGLLLFEKESIAADFPRLFNLIINLNIIYLLFMFVTASYGILDALERYYNTFAIAKRRPIKSYLQIVKVTLVLVVAILYLFEDPSKVLVSMGAFSAVLLLVFRESILGFLASIQLSSYDMIRIGDWITVPKFGADGDVEEISLTTVKVRNFDKTITTIPSSSLVNEGVQNWRGMTSSGGRRIKRNIRLDLRSATFLNSRILESISSLPFLQETLKAEKQKLESGKLHELRTNVQLFREYLEHYVASRKDTYNQGFTFMVRELEADSYGLPIQLYVFTTTTVWKDYEKIQADIFDHAFAVLPFFKLKPFQNITGTIETKEV